MGPGPALHILDACSLLNLVASRRFMDIASAMPGSFLTSEQAAREVRYVRKGGGAPDAQEREAIDLEPFQRLGLLAVSNLKSPAEVATFIDFATEMSDGEAAACALAVHRGGVLVTDDRKARRVVSQRFPGTLLSTTSELIKAWADQAGLDAPEIARVLLDVEQRGNFRPGRHDPLESWWNEARNQL